MKLSRIIVWIILGLLALLSGTVALLAWYNSGFGDPTGPLEQQTLYGARVPSRVVAVNTTVTDWRQQDGPAAVPDRAAQPGPPPDGGDE